MSATLCPELRPQGNPSVVFTFVTPIQSYIHDYITLTSGKALQREGEVSNAAVHSVEC